MNFAKIATAAALLVCASPVFAQDAAAPAGNADNGKQFFMKDGCYECHGTVGQGASTGPRIARTAFTYDQFLNQLRHPAFEMAPYEAAVVPDSTAADIYAYLESLPTPPDWKGIALLNDKSAK